jgi:hypothetical protein
MNEYSTLFLPLVVMIAVLLIVLGVLLLPDTPVRERRRGGTPSLRASLQRWSRTLRRERWVSAGLRRVRRAIIAVIVGVWALAQAELVRHLWAALQRWLGW